MRTTGNASTHSATSRATTGTSRRQRPSPRRGDSGVPISIVAVVPDDGPVAWTASHKNVRLQPLAERDLDLLVRMDTDPWLQEPYEWRGFRDPQRHRRR